MTIWTTSSDASTTSGNIPVRKVRMATIPFNVKGLRPKSKYTLWINGVDMSWACKTSGSRMGDDLVSDERGTLSISILTEVNPISSGSNSTDALFHTIILKDVSGNAMTSTVFQQNLFRK